MNRFPATPMRIRVLHEKREDTLGAGMEQCGGTENGNQKREIGVMGAAERKNIKPRRGGRGVRRGKRKRGHGCGEGAAGGGRGKPRPYRGRKKSRSGEWAA